MSSLSPERDGREGGETNFGFDPGSEGEGRRGRGRGGRGGEKKGLRYREEAQSDIVSDIYSTAFSKVPKVS